MIKQHVDLNTAPAAITITGLRKRYPRAPKDAVAGLDLRIAPGEVYGLLGPNGSGKSTTVQVVATLLAPTAGTVEVVGHDVSEAPEAVRRQLGVTLQDAGVDPLATGRELLTLHGRLLGASRSDAAARAAQLLDEVGLADAADRRIRSYSGGMRRRLDLAAALVGRPAVVLLDEPTTGLDPASREALWHRVRGLRDDGVAVLLTTQYLEEADRLADRVGVLADGLLRAEGSPAALKAEHGAATLDDVFFAVTGLPRPARDGLTAVAA